jgi:membrane protease YdiL (CAAX protease family)
VTSSVSEQAEEQTHGVVATRIRALELWVALALIVVWFALLTKFGAGDIYAVLGPYACVVAIVCYALRPRELRAALAVNLRSVLYGVGAGLVMTFLTYPAFRLAVQLVPQLDEQVQSLYTGAYSTTVPKALAWLTALVLAEEMLFRGLLPSALRERTGQRNAYVVALIAYTLAQLGSGSWIVALLAFGCGAVWTLLKAQSGSLLAPLIAHAIWTPTLILLYPVT